VPIPWSKYDVFKGSLKALPFLVTLLIGLLIITFSVTGFDLSMIPGDFADARFNIYLLEHAHQFFFGGQVATSNYWDAPFFYPERSIITYSDNLLGTFLIYSFFRFLELDTHSAFQLWFFTLTILNFSSAYFFLNSLLKDRYSSALGAFVFAFSIALFGQLQHAQTFARFPIPLAFWAASNFITYLKPKYFFLTLFFLVYQFYCAIYLGFLLAVPLGIFLVTVFFQPSFYDRLRNLKWVVSVIAGFAINIALLLILLLPYANNASRMQTKGLGAEYAYTAIFDSIPSFYSYLLVNTDSLLWDRLGILSYLFDKWWDHQLFPGGLVILFSAFMLIYLLRKLLENPSKYLSPLKSAMLLSSVFCFLLFIRFDELSLYAVLHKLPGFFAIRAPQRIINVELIFLSLIVAYVIRDLNRRVKIKPVFFLTFLILLCIDNYVTPNAYVRFDKSSSLQRIEGLSKKIAEFPKGTIISYEPYLEELPPIYAHIDAMLAAQENGLACLNGYSSKCPDVLVQYCDLPNENNRLYWLDHMGVKGNVEVITDIPPEEIEAIIQKIESTEEWREKVLKNAEKKNISFRESAVENAIWFYKNTH
jgi:hypothetical protein